MPAEKRGAFNRFAKVSLVFVGVLLFSLHIKQSPDKVGATDFSYSNPTEITTLEANIRALYSSKEEMVRAPVLLEISKIGVWANIEQVGLTLRGAVDAPTDSTSAGWFDKSSRPGDPGVAIIDGHFGWKDGKVAVFDNLHKLVKGDKITVTARDGTISVFVVRELKTYAEKDDTTNVFVSNDSGAHLNLITCIGTWNKKNKSYSGRLVVFADKVI